MYKTKYGTICITTDMTTITYTDGSMLRIKKEYPMILGYEFAEAKYRRFGIMAARILSK